MKERFETFVNAITDIYRSLQKLKNQEMMDFGLKGSHVMILFQLRQHPAGLTSAQIAELTEEDKAAVSRSINELREKHLVMIPEGRYRAIITLTDDGHVVTRKMDQKIVEAVCTAAQGYTEEERNTFYRVLLQVAGNLQKAAFAKEERN